MHCGLFLSFPLSFSITLGLHKDHTLEGPEGREGPCMMDLEQDPGRGFFISEL